MTRFGNVGSWGADIRQGMGAKLVAVNDADGTIFNPDGIDVQALMAYTPDPKNLKRWLVLIDGDPDLENWVRAAAAAHKVEVTIVLDLLHALQYVWRAGVVLCGKGSDALESWVLERLVSILKGNVANAVAGITRSATLRNIKGRQREELRKCCAYLLKRKSLMRYGDLLGVGAPIASGVIEGGCKHLINDRLQLCGARWSLKGAEAILRIRAIVISGNFDEFWRYHEARESARNHARLYAGAVPPVVSQISAREQR